MNFHYIDLPIDHQQTLYMEKVINIECHSCKVKFPIRVTLKEPTRNGSSDQDTLTKTCPNCSTENQVTLPNTIQLKNTGSTLRGTNPDE